MSNLQYRLDKLGFSTLLPNFINVQTGTGSITVSGSLTNGASQNYSVTIPLSSQTNFADVYATAGTAKSALVNNQVISNIFSFVSSEFVQNEVEYAGGNVTVTITVSNFTGSTITLHSQTFSIEVVEYKLPL